MSKQKYLNAFTGEYEILDEEEAIKIQEKLDYITFKDYSELKKGQHSTREIHLMHELNELKCYKSMYDKAREKVNSLSKEKERTHEEWLYANVEVARFRNAIMNIIDHILI
jgi:hypothetical protein